MAAAVGAVIGAVGQMKQAKAAEKAEKAREKMMNLDVQRKRREAIRQAVMARSVALSNAVAQGAEKGSALQGGYGQIGGDLRRNTVALGQDQQLGKQVFAANRAYAQGGMIASIGNGISNAGDSFDKLFSLIS